MVVEIINGEEQPDINAEITEFDMDEELLSSLDDDSRLQGVARELADTGDMSTCFGFEVNNLKFIIFLLFLVKPFAVVITFLFI